MTAAIMQPGTELLALPYAFHMLVLARRCNADASQVVTALFVF
jgi:hypothetical protein